MTSMKVFSKDFRKDIAGLRALAVMLVLLNHFQISGFGFGFIGVGIGMDSRYGNYSGGDMIGCCQDTTGINRSARVEVYIR